LVERATEIGLLLQGRLVDMQSRVTLIGEVRALGAMVAIELVDDRTTREPATAEAERVHEICWNEGLLLAKAGLHANVIRLLVPLVATTTEIERGLAVLDHALNTAAGPSTASIQGEGN